MIKAELRNAKYPPKPCWLILDDDGEDRFGKPLPRRYYMCPYCMEVYNTRLHPDSCERCGQRFNGCELH